MNNPQAEIRSFADFHCWESPLSGVDFIKILNINKSDGVIVDVKELNSDGNGQDYTISFLKVCFFLSWDCLFHGTWSSDYKGISEPLVAPMAEKGPIFTISNSPWLTRVAELPFVNEAFPNLRHFVVASPIQILEVLTNTDPTVTLKP